MGERVKCTNKVNRILINGVEPTNTKVTNISTNFLLDQTFCSCPTYFTAVKVAPGWCDRCWLDVVSHYDFCSGGEGKKKIGVYDIDKNEVILEGGYSVPFH